MTRWVVSPDWRDATAKLLYRTLEHVWQRERIEEVCLSIGMSPAHVHFYTSATLTWPAVVRDAFDTGRLEALILEVRERVPALAANLDLVLAAENATANWYLPVDKEQSVLIGPGCVRALIDREGLRENIRRMMKNDYSILAISGAPGSGKSYSRHLLQHVLHGMVPACELIVIDVENDWYDDVSGFELMSALLVKLGLDRLKPTDENIEQSRAVRELMDQFVGRFRHLSHRSRWIFIDGLDRPWVRPCAHLAVGRMAKEIEAGQLHGARLVVTGHPGDFCTDVMDVLLAESLGAVTEDHLRAFFHNVADTVGQRIEPAEASAIVAEVLAESSLVDLRALGAVAGRAAHTRFAPKAAL